MARENKYLSKKEINTLKDKLLASKEEILNKEKEFDKFCLSKNELKDPLDEANVNVQTSQELRFRNRELFYLKKINKTLAKVEDHTYGLCEDCGVEIGYDRLWARPTAEMCITCKEEAEMEEKSNYYLKQSKSLGKSMADLRR